MHNRIHWRFVPVSMILTMALLGAGFSTEAEARGYRGHGGHHHGGHHRGHGGHHGAYLVGGLLLGGLLTDAYHRRHDRYVVHETRVRTIPAQPYVGRRLFRDLDGNCFERTTTRAGDELMVELDRVECEW